MVGSLKMGGSYMMPMLIERIFQKRKRKNIILMLIASRFSLLLGVKEKGVMFEKLSFGAK